jgi:prepilin-type N-terminal cleavage/methylation domain-containing protein
MKFKSNHSLRQHKAFTLVELLTVIAIIGILAAVLIPSVGAALDKAKNAKSQSNLGEIGKNAFLYGQRYQGKSLPIEADIDNDDKMDNWWEIITYMSSGSTKQANSKNAAEGLRPFEDPLWPDDPDYDKKKIGIALNATPGLPDIKHRNSAAKGTRDREFRISQIDFPSRRLLATTWNKMEIEADSITRESYSRALIRYKDHINIVYFDAHVGQYEPDQFDEFKNSIEKPGKRKK